MNDPEPQKDIDTSHTETITCGDCGAGNPAGASECSVCGSLLHDDISPPQASAQPVQSAIRPRSSAARDYILFGVGAILLTLLVYMISAPEETKGPARGGGNTASAGHGAPEGGMPPGHPPMDEGMTPQQRQEMEQKQQMLEAREGELRARLKATPGDDSVRLQLANTLYDKNEHAEAVTLYREFLKKDPNNPDVRTDMAYSMANLNDIDGAIVELQGVATKHPKHQNSALNLAMMYHVKGTPDSTLYWLKKVAAIDATTPQGREAARIVADLSARKPGGPSHPSP